MSATNPEGVIPAGAEPARVALSGIASSSSAPRFEYIDGLRGLASIMVAIGHLADAAQDKHPGILGPGVMELADFGRYGVQIFFVLSGFVIAHSVAGGAFSFSYLGRFAARRFVRLDLPYWSVIAFEILLLWLTGLVMVQYLRDLPGIPQILANAFYLQQFLGYKHILPVFWTLCYEVQFYLVLVLSLVLLTKLRNAGTGDRMVRTIATVALALSFCWSLSIYLGLAPNPSRALFIDRWFQFALGVVTYLFYRNYCGWLPIAAVMTLSIAGGLMFGADNYRVTSTILTAATGLAILGSLWLPWWNALLIGPTMQFLGRISYSLYLLHTVIGWRATALTRELIGSQYSTVAAYFAFFVGLGASIFGAWVMYVLIERPAVNIARKIRLPRRGERSAPVGIATSADASLTAPSRAPAD